MNTEEARDAILTVFKDAWDAGALTASGEATVPAVEYEGVIYEAPLARDGSKPWARVSIRHNISRQRTMGGLGQRTFERLGVVTVQVFVPAGKRGLMTAVRLAKLVIDAFEAPPSSGSLWFRNVRSKEVGPDGAWYQVNVVAEFQYDEVK